MELISREEVIKLLNEHIAYLYDEDEKAYMSVVVVKEDIKRLSPIEEIPTDYAEGYKKGYIDGGVDALISRPKGKWQRWNDVLECSVCGYGLMSPTVFRGAECVAIRKPCYFKYCPICGSEMEHYEEFWIPNNK